MMSVPLTANLRLALPVHPAHLYHLHVDDEEYDDLHVDDLGHHLEKEPVHSNLPRMAAHCNLT